MPSQCDFHFKALVEIKDDVKGLHLKIEKITDSISSIDKTLSLQAENLRTHIKRTDQLEEFSKKVDNRVLNLEEKDRKMTWAFGILMSVLGVLLTISGLYISYKYGH